MALSLQKEIIACKGSERKMYSNLNTDVQASVTNQSAIHVGRNPEHHTAACNTFCPSITGCGNRLKIKCFLLTISMRTDVLTKLLDTVAHQRVCSLLGLVSQPAL
jgi:hypothetical protein